MSQLHEPSDNERGTPDAMMQMLGKKPKDPARNLIFAHDHHHPKSPSVIMYLKTRQTVTSPPSPEKKMLAGPNA